jgi:DNA-binding transcriptional regulator YiaG
MMGASMFKRRYAVTTKFKSEALQSVHESAIALFEIGTIDKATMRDFDQTCIAEVPAAINPAQENPGTQSC